MTKLTSEIIEAACRVYLNSDSNQYEAFGEAIQKALELLQAQADPVANQVLVTRSSFDWLRKNYPAVCAKAGLHEIYTHPAPREAVPDGWKLVPIDLTEEIIKIMDECEEDKHTRESAWKAMLNASPKYRPQ